VSIHCAGESFTVYLLSEIHVCVYNAWYNEEDNGKISGRQANGKRVNCVLQQRAGIIVNLPVPAITYELNHTK
jgi:hypothetical protein